MVTQSHIILNTAFLSKRANPTLHRYAFLGAVLPDLPMFIFFAAETLIRRTPQSELWDTRYYIDAWQTFFDLFNAVPLILILLGVGVYGFRSEKTVTFAWSMLLHCGFDLITHHDDGHRHLFPISDFIFQSPISYWDPDHYGAIVSPIEQLLVFGASIYLYPRLKTRLARVSLIIVNVLSLVVTLRFLL